MKSSKTHMDIAKAVIALMIVLVAFGIFLIFNSYKDTILSSTSNFQSFMILAVIGAGLLAGLLFLVSKSEHPTHHVARAHTKSKSRSKKRR